MKTFTASQVKEIIYLFMHESKEKAINHENFDKFTKDFDANFHPTNENYKKDYLITTKEWD